MKKLSIALAALALVFGVATSAHADEQATAQRGRGVITLPERVITGRAQRPEVAIAVSKLPQRGTLAVLELPLIGRIEAAISTEPF